MSGLDTVTAGAYINNKAAESTTALIQQSISNYCAKTHTKRDEQWSQHTFQWISQAVEKRMNNTKTVNIAKLYEMEKEKVREGGNSTHRDIHTHYSA